MNLKGLAIFTGLFLLATDAAIILDITVIRQLFGFFLLAFLPGYLVLLSMRSSSLRLTEVITTSVGLSISIVMFYGLLVNLVFVLFGFHAPFTTNSLLIAFNILIPTLIVVAYLRNQTPSSFKMTLPKLTSGEGAILALPALFPPLAIIGTHLMNTTGNNIILMITILLILAYVIWATVMHNKAPDKLYPMILIYISLSIVIMLALRSNFIIGVDIHQEYYIFQQTLVSGQWQIVLGSALDSCLSISILPVTFQRITGIDPEFLFKILYAILFSLCPLVIYIIAGKYMRSIHAFLASLFFMSQTYFINAAFSPRTVLAIFFLL